MSLFNIFDIAGSAVSAQSLRLNTTASNLANADSVASDPDSVYRARQPVFQAMSLPDGRAGAGVRMLGVVESTAPPNVRHDPNHPMANAEGDVFAANVDPVAELVNMISASRSYQTNVEVINTSKTLLLRTLSLGQ
jgi:flagellar basal-body rod protein FlgC